MLYAMFVTKLTLQASSDVKKNIEKRKEFMAYPQASFWLLIEVNYFWMNLFGQVLFLVVA
jgi:hypothetical protein